MYVIIFNVGYSNINRHIFRLRYCRSQNAFVSHVESIYNSSMGKPSWNGYRLLYKYSIRTRIYTGIVKATHSRLIAGKNLSRHVVDTPYYPAGIAPTSIELFVFRLTGHVSAR